jgi:hydrogenase nickel incorporation protein HypB
LVCPAAYDLGEAMKVVLFSVTEGEDKPLKYPTTFKNADVVLLTKTDIAEAVGCDLALARQNIHAIAPQAELFELSARSGAGMTDWYFYLQTRLVPVPQLQEMPWLESSRS